MLASARCFRRAARCSLRSPLLLSPVGHRIDTRHRRSENPFELINSLGVGALLLAMGASFVPYANGSGAVSMEDVGAFSLYQGCSSFDACLPLASEGALAASLVVTALVVTRNFGWRAYRKFGATTKGTRLKVIYHIPHATHLPTCLTQCTPYLLADFITALQAVYRTRKLFASFLKIDVVLAILQLIGTVTYMFKCAAGSRPHLEPPSFSHIYISPRAFYPDHAHPPLERTFPRPLQPYPSHLCSPYAFLLMYLADNRGVAARIPPPLNHSHPRQPVCMARFAPHRALRPPCRRARRLGLGCWDLPGRP